VPPRPTDNTGLLNFRFERVANSFIQALECSDFQFGAITLIEKDFPMPFVDTNDDVFLGEKSFATWHEALDRYETLPVHKNSPRTWRAGHKELFAQMREYLTAAKKEYLANDTADGLVQPMRAAFPSFDGDVLLHHPLRFLFPKS
jgi:hypothetical protein